MNSIFDKVTCYISYCVELVLPCKKIRIFPKNKPWAKGQVKAAFYSGDKDRIGDAQRTLKAAIRQWKCDYKEEVEGRMSSSSTKELWNGVKSITGYRTGNQSCCGSGITANDANAFLFFFFFRDTQKHFWLP